MTRVAIIGAGIIGASCALYAARAGLQVTVLERHSVAAGTTGAGEGNLLVSDKTPGAELELAQRSLQLWDELAAEIGAHALEFEHKGGLIVARSEPAMTALSASATRQRAAGVVNDVVDADGLRQLEPHLARDAGLAGGVFYPDDAQLQPVLATARLLQAAIDAGATLRLGVDVTGAKLADGRIAALTTSAGTIASDYVVNAAGTWAGQLGSALGAPVPVAPRRGFILVTEPLPPMIRHKVYSADYVANVASNSQGLETSSVIEGTRSGPVLIGASRERVDFRRTISLPVVRRLAALAIELFPALRTVNLMRTYVGFRPYCPDHLPIIGADPRVPGLLHACGHEGAGIGLAPATGELIAQLITEQPTSVGADSFRPDRLIGHAA
jgi:glycine/D-amino acid oxidase-like deaminating enzyme